MGHEIPLGDLPLAELNELLVDVFSQAIKVDGSSYPSATLMNMLNAFNHIIRRAYEVRSLGLEGGYRVDKSFNIISHPAFAKTWMAVNVAIKQSPKVGLNKRKDKVKFLTRKMEKAALTDIDHEVTSSHGCKKWLAFYTLCRLGIHGGSELHDLHREDFNLRVDKTGKEYIKFEEWQRKTILVSKIVSLKIVFNGLKWSDPLFNKAC